MKLMRFFALCPTREVDHLGELTFKEKDGSMGQSAQRSAFASLGATILVYHDATPREDDLREVSALHGIITAREGIEQARALARHVSTSTAPSSTGVPPA